MALPRSVGRAPSPRPPKPLPLWPLVLGPVLGSLVGLLLSTLDSRIRLSFSGTLGFGMGMLCGLLGVLTILLGRRQYTSETWLVAFGAVGVLGGLVRMWFF